MMDVDGENQPANANIDNNNQKKDQPPGTLPLSPPHSVSENTGSTGINETEKKDLPGDKLSDSATNQPLPRLAQAYIQESKSYLSDVSDLKIWKDLVDIWVQFEINCPQRGVSILFFTIL